MTTASMTTTAAPSSGLPQPSTVRAHTPWAALILTGAIGGILSGLFAIGGAIVMVPLLVWRAGMDQRRAAATSLVAIIPTAVVEFGDLPGPRRRRHRRRSVDLGRRDRRRDHR